jgi:asparagine N-glycosylation enzyme membrane subunit Stt3
MVPHWLFEPGMFLGVGALAVWMHVRFPKLEPRSMRLALVHLGGAVLLFNLAPMIVGLSMTSLPQPLSVAVAIAGVTIPTFCYVLMSVIWLLARIRDEIGSTPRGGHPARSSQN